MLSYTLFKNSLFTQDYITLQDSEYEASLGKDYTYLNNINPSWANKLHAYGHIMPESELCEIFKNGLLTWYCIHHINTYKILLRQVTYPIQFHDAVRHIKLHIYLIQGPNSDRDKLIHILDYPNYQIMMHAKNWTIPSSFHIYLELYNLLYTYNQLVLELKTYIKPEMHDILHQNKCVDILFQKSEMTYIMKLGLSFMRWKIVVEKVSKLCKLYPELCENLIIYDRFTTRIQEMLCIEVQILVEKYLGIVQVFTLSCEIYTIICNMICIQGSQLFAPKPEDQLIEFHACKLLGFNN